MSLSVSRLFIRFVGLLASLAIAVPTALIVVLVLERNRRFRAESPLPRRQKRKRLILEPSPDGTALVSPKGKNISANPSAEKLVGCTRDELIAESEEQQNGDELAHSTRIEILGQMAGSLAHELNQPLTSIMNNANAGRRFIATGRGDIAKINELLAAIIEDARRAASIIRGIRGLIRKREGGRGSVDVNRIVEDVLQLVQSNAVKRHCVVEATLTPRLPMVKANPVLIQQVLLNILVNAFDAMSDTVKEQRRVIVRSECELGGLVKVSVRDFGRGLPPGSANQIFDHFFSTKPKGLGMGLAIARSIIISHGGELGAENAEGRGALVYFALPAAGKDSTATTDVVG